MVNDYPDYDLIEEPGKMLKFPYDEMSRIAVPSLILSYVKEFVRTGPSFEKEYVSFGYMAPLNWYALSGLTPFLNVGGDIARSVAVKSQWPTLWIS